MISRRNFIKAIAAAAIIYPLSARSSFASKKDMKTLNLHNVHTDENLRIAYWHDGDYDNEAVSKIRHILRCHYTNQVSEIDIRVLDLLSDIKDIIGQSTPLKIISGYRSPDYNEYLRSLGRRVSKDSLHLKGLAVDFAVDGISTGRLSGIARSFAAGGVGRYPDFVHIDVGRVRYW
ncbi:MAG: DUF882 domain-containing protein [Nitrospirae bacterium]|nr:DUF882 domain-containing protein [Nitrospirota bacterium]